MESKEEKAATEVENSASFKNLESRMHVLDGAIEDIKLEKPTTSALDTTTITEAVSTDSQESSAARSESTCNTLRSRRSSLSFIGRKSLYNLAMGMGDLEDEIDHIREDASGGSPYKSRRDSFAFSRTFSDDAIDDLQNELAMADQQYDEIMDTTLNTTMEEDEENEDALEDEGTGRTSPRTARFLRTRFESEDFPLPSPPRQERQPDNPISWSESREGLQEEIEEADRMQTKSKSAFGQPEVVLAAVQVQEKNRVLETEIVSLQSDRKKLEAQHDQALNEVRGKVEALSKELDKSQAKHATEICRAQEERANLEKEVAAQQKKLAKLESRQQEVLRGQEARQNKLERDLANAKEEGESVKSVYSNMVLTHQRENGVLQKQIKDIEESHTLERTRFEQEIESMEQRLIFHTGTMEKLDVKYKSEMVAQQEKKRALEKQIDELIANHEKQSTISQAENETLDKKIISQQEIIDKLNDQHAKALQDNEANRVLQLGQARAEKEALEKKLGSLENAMEGLESQHKEKLDVEYQKSTALENRLKDSETIRGAKAREFEEDKQLLVDQISQQREKVEQMESQRKTAIDIQTEKAKTIEKSMTDLKLSHAQQLSRVKEENEVLRHDLATLQEMVEEMKSKHKNAVLALHEEKHLLENQIRELVASNDSLVPTLASQEERIKHLGMQHKAELKVQEAKEHRLQEEVAGLKAVYEAKIVETEKQKESLKRYHLRHEETIRQLEATHKNESKGQCEQQILLEKQLESMGNEYQRINDEQAKSVKAQEESFVSATLQLNEMKSLREVEADNAQKEHQAVELKLSERQTKIELLEAQHVKHMDAAHERHRSLTKELDTLHSAYNKVKADYANFVTAMEESGTLSDQDTKESSISRDLALNSLHDLDPLKTEDSSTTTRVWWPLAILLLALLAIFFYFFAANAGPMNIENPESLRSQIELFRNEKIQLESKVLDTESALFELKSNLSESKEESLRYKQHADKLDSEILLLRSDKEECAVSSKDLYLQMQSMQRQTSIQASPEESRAQSLVSDLRAQLKEAQQEDTRTKESLQTAATRLSSLESGRGLLEKKLEDAETSFETIESRFRQSQEDSQQNKEKLLTIEKKAKMLEIEKAKVQSQLVRTEEMLSNAQLQLSNGQHKIDVLQAVHTQLKRVGMLAHKLASQQVHSLIRVSQTCRMGASGKVKQIKSATSKMLQTAKRKVSHVVRSDRGKINSEESAWLVL